MFGWFAPRCPLEPAEKVSLERMFARLLDEFGSERLREAKVVEPTAEFFPDAYVGTNEDAEALLARVAGYLQVPGTVRLDVVPDDQFRTSAWLSEGESSRTVRVAASLLNHPEPLIAEFAHQLTLALVPGPSGAAGRERQAQLLAIFLGMGAFAENVRVWTQQPPSADPFLTATDPYRLLTPRELGYAHALFAWLRYERRPPWFRALSLDAQVAAEQGLKFLERTGDCIFSPERPKTPPALHDPQEARRRLESRSPSERLDTVRELGSHAALAESIVREIVFCLGDTHPSVRAASALTLGRLGAAAVGAVSEIMLGLLDASPEVRSASATAIGALGPPLETPGPDERPLLDELAAMLRDESRSVVLSAADTLAEFGPAAAPAIPALLTALRKALVHCDDLTAVRLFRAIERIDPTPTETVRDWLTGGDQELFQSFAALQLPDSDSHELDAEDGQRGAP